MPYALFQRDENLHTSKFSKPKRGHRFWQKLSSILGNMSAPEIQGQAILSRYSELSRGSCQARREWQHPSLCSGTWVKRRPSACTPSNAWHRWRLTITAQLCRLHSNQSLSTFRAYETECIRAWTEPCKSNCPPPGTRQSCVKSHSFSPFSSAE